MAKKTATSPPKGTRDFLPSDIRKREFVTSVIREVYEAHGYQPLETPAFERLSTLLGKYGEEGDQLVFKILHRGAQLVEGIRKGHEHLQQPGVVTTGRSGEVAPSAELLLTDLGLRYDLTVPLARVYAENRGRLPPGLFKRYQIQPVWRADRPGKGRFREFYQCDVDVVGSDSLLVEAEVCGAVAECLDRLGFGGCTIRLNHRALLRSLIDIAGIDPKRESEAIIAIDKHDKVGEEGVALELEQKGISAEARQKLMEIVFGEPTIDQVRALIGEHEGGQRALRDLDEVLQLAKLTPAAPLLRFDPTLARGLGYYTGCIFEVAMEGLSGSLGGGGRYDGLIGMFLGKESVPACGFSIGLERILVIMEEREMFGSVAGAQVLVATHERDRLPDALSLSYRLRERGLRVELSPKKEKNAGKVRQAADKRGIPVVVILGRETETANLWTKSDPKRTDRMVPMAEIGSAVEEAVGEPTAV